MITKLSKVKELMKNGEERKALAMVARFGRLGKEKDDIQRGHDAINNPNFYIEIGKNPQELFNTAIQAIKTKYKIGA